MTKLEKVKFFKERDIIWYIGYGRTVYGLCKMSTHNGDDCSEWIDASKLIEAIKEQEVYFNKPKTGGK